jgi:hypothetical protein
VLRKQPCCARKGPEFNPQLDQKISFNFFFELFLGLVIVERGRGREVVLREEEFKTSILF